MNQVSSDFRLLHGKTSPVRVIHLFDSDGARLAVSQLLDYLEKCTGVRAEMIAFTPGMELPFPVLVIADSGHARQWTDLAEMDDRTEYRIRITHRDTGPLAVLCADHVGGLHQAVHRMIRLARQTEDGIGVQEIRMESKPWIAQREWALCPWVPGQIRGEFTNPHANPAVDIFLFSERQLEDYIRMMGSFGYNGVQLMDTCYMWSRFGTIEAYHDKLKQIARIARKWGQSVTYWVWTACFEGFGWTDREAVYVAREGMSAFEDPLVRATFEKYYDKYSEMAPYVDRVIGHFYDPGQLENPEDTFRYMRLLERKCRRINPDLTFGIDVWAGPSGYLQALIQAGFHDYLLLESSFPALWKEENCREFRAESLKSGIRQTGVWGWYTTEYETDQRPSMYVNGHILKEVYTNIRRVADPILPNVYWSEMEACHLVNIYSMYVSAQLLCNPDGDPDLLLEQFVKGIWGAENGAKVLEVLKLIADTRSGTGWSTYWWTSPEFRLGTPDATEDARRAAVCLQLIEQTQADNGFVSKTPLPVSVRQLGKLIVPHVVQIKQFAEFRIRMADIEQKARQGVTKDELFNLLKAAWLPIPDYDTWVGDYGQIENARQYAIVSKLCKQWGIPLPVDALSRFKRKYRTLETMENFQKSYALQGPRPFTAKFLAVYGYCFDVEEAAQILDELAREHIIVQNGDGTYALSDWGSFQSAY